MSIQLKSKFCSFNQFNAQTFLLTAVTVLLCSAGWSQSYTSRAGDSINPQFYISAGLFYPNMTTSLRVDSKIGIGTEIGLEDDLNLSEDVGVFRIDGLIRLTENSQLRATYTRIHRDRNLRLEEDIKFGDRVLEEGSNVGYNFDVDYIGATYRYNFFNQENWSAGLSAGLRGIFISTQFDGQLNALQFTEKATFTAPAILFGAHGSAYLTPRLLARYSLEMLYLTISDISINIVESNAAVEYYIFKNVGIGLAYSTNNYRLTNLPLWGDSDGKVNFEFSGFNLYFSARF